MTIRYHKKLIDECREDTGETDFSAYNGVPQSAVLASFEEAYVHCVNAIYSNYASFLEVKTLISIVAGQAEYELPDTAYLGGGIRSIRYSSDGSEDEYERLWLVGASTQYSGSGEPEGYFERGERTIVLSPAPSRAGGVLEVTHAVWPDRPALRSGLIEGVQKNGGLTEYTVLALADDSWLDEATIESDENLCVNDRNGNVVFRNAAYSYNSSTKELTLTGALVASGTISEGDYVCIGTDVTSHLKLDRMAEPVIKSFIRRRLLQGKSSNDVVLESENISAFTAEMVTAYQLRNRDAKTVRYMGIHE